MSRFFYRFLLTLTVMFLPWFAMGALWRPPGEALPVLDEVAGSALALTILSGIALWWDCPWGGLLLATTTAALAVIGFLDRPFQGTAVGGAAMLPYVAFRFLQLRRAGQYSGGYFSIASDRAPSAVMPRNMYRFAVVLLLVLYPWFVEITAVGDAASRNSLIAFLGLALQGTAAIGLWSDERWAALVLLAAASVSAYTRFGVAGESVVMLPLVALRFYQVHRAHRTTDSHPSPEPRAGHGTS